MMDEKAIAFEIEAVAQDQFYNSLVATNFILDNTGYKG
jgi:hypothetical protein